MNKVTFEGRACVLDGRTWRADGGHESPDLIAALDEYTQALDGPTPADGFITEGAFLARRAADFFGGRVEELDPPPAPEKGRGPEVVY